ncbi:Nucleoporin [Trypanosoma brucei equiperdum]|uniref:Nucleoporin n=1 Tax=Trypanosoma brucei equiperdum TaxID=630700 RepID=A0A3L6LFZ3_9TRYP|nr:Nucleoporin [Trypanosoma brucei equiperdum]
MHRKTIVSNYFITPEHSIAVPRIFTPNVSVEDITLSDTPTQLSTSVAQARAPGPQAAALTVGGKRGRESSWYSRCHNNSIGENTVGFAGATPGSHHCDVVNPYDESHQGPVRPISDFGERAIHSESLDAYRHAKLPRKEPITAASTAGNREGASFASMSADLVRLQEQYEKLNRSIEEARDELRRSREEIERSKQHADQAITDLRVEVAQLSKHVQLLEGRNTSVEQSVSSLNGMRRVVECLQSELLTLRKETTQNSTAVAVLEKLLDDIKHQPRIPQAPANLSAGSANRQPTSSGVAPFTSPAAEPPVAPVLTGTVSSSSTGINAVSTNKSSATFGTLISTEGSAAPPKSSGTFSFGSVAVTATHEDKTSSPFGTAKPAGGPTEGTATTPKSADTYSFGGLNSATAATSEPPTPFSIPAAPASATPTGGSETTPASANRFSFGSISTAKPFGPNASTPFGAAVSTEGATATQPQAPSGGFSFGGAGATESSTSSFSFGNAPKPVENTTNGNNAAAASAPGPGGCFSFPSSSAAQTSVSTGPEVTRDPLPNASPFATLSEPTAFGNNASFPVGALAPTTAFGSATTTSNSFGSVQWDGSGALKPAAPQEGITSSVRKRPCRRY